MRKLSRVAGLTALFTLLLPCRGALMTISSRTAFESAAPGLPVETFESGLVAAGDVTACSGPLSSAAASACFPVGALLSGVTYSAAFGISQTDMVVLGSGAAGLPTTSKVVGPNLFLETLNVTFAQTFAAGFDVYPGPIAGDVVISVFSPANVALGTFTIAAPLNGTFFGVISDATLIGRLNIASQSESAGEVIDNLAFGSTAVVPEAGAISFTGAGLFTILGLRLHRRRARYEPNTTGSIPSPKPPASEGTS